MKCKNCGLTLVEGDLICPNCGEFVQSKTQNEEPPILDIPIEERIPDSIPDNSEESITEESNIPDAVIQDGSQPELVLNDPAQISQKKSVNKWLIFGICGTTALAILLLAFSFGPLNGWLVRTFSSPAALLNQVYQNSADSTISLLYQGLEENSSVAESNLNCAQVHIKPSQLMLDMLAMSMNSDSSQLSWLSDIVLTGTVNNNDSLAKNTLGIALGEHDIITLEQILDTKSGKQWYVLPELSQTALMIDTNEYSDFSASSGTIDFASALPEEKAMQEMIDKYLTIALSAFGYVQRSQDTFCIEEVEQKLTVLEAKATEEEMLKTTIKLLEEMKNDPIIKQMLDDLCHQALSLPGNDQIVPDYYAQFVSSIDEELEACAEQIAMADPENILSVYTYINGSNRLVGIRLEATGMQESLQFMMLNQGNRVAFQAVLDTVVISGKFTIDASINGKMTLYSDEEAYLTCAFDKVIYKNSHLSGTFVIAPTAVLVKEIAYSITEDMTTAVQTAMNSIALEVTLTQEKETVSMDLLLNNNSMITIETERIDVPTQEIVVPDSYVDVLDQKALEDWTKELNIMAFVENLSDAGVPAELLFVLLGALVSS